MLQKSRSKKVFKLKYLLLVPMIFSMLAYTSFEQQVPNDITESNETPTEEVILVDNIEKLDHQEEQLIFQKLQELQSREDKWMLFVKDKANTLEFTKSANGSYISGPNNEKINAKMTYHSSSSGADTLTYSDVLKAKSLSMVDDKDRIRNEIKESNEVPTEEIVLEQEPKVVTFSNVDQVPVFPGCENKKDTKACFQKRMQKHIRKHFNYPIKAQEKGIQGRVSVIFTMNTFGDIVNVRTKGPDKLLEDEAVRIISKMPSVKPGIHKGEKVNVSFSIPITFKLTKSGKNEKSDGYDKNVDVPFSIVEEVPIFPGCENEENTRACFNKMMQTHISKNFRYPEEAQKKGLQGRVNVMFTIGKEGAIQNVRMRGPDPILEKEVARIISLLPKMTQGKQKGKAVNVPFSIPISFKIQSEPYKFQDIKLSNETNKEPVFTEGGGLNFRPSNLEPIYFIDGKESTKDKLNTINPNDIESISVLKDEAAINVYGEKGKNGVIQVTTKKND